MKVRYKKDKVEGYSSRFNQASIFEVTVFGDWGGDSASPTDLEVFLPSKGEWKCMMQAFRDHDLITDNYNTHFFEPENEGERRRGYSLP
jgi:hypothetical protein